MCDAGREEEINIASYNGEVIHFKFVYLWIRDTSYRIMSSAMSTFITNNSDTLGIGGQLNEISIMVADDFSSPDRKYIQDMLRHCRQ